MSSINRSTNFLFQLKQPKYKTNQNKIRQLPQGRPNSFPRSRAVVYFFSRLLDDFIIFFFFKDFLLQRALVCFIFKTARRPGGPPGK
jgi:hypothetical protein